MKDIHKNTLKKSYLEILNIIETHCALNAYEIFERLKNQDIKNVSQTTVYRALNYFVENHFIKPIYLNDGHTRYEIVNTKNHHHHFICTECKTLYPLEYCPFEDTGKILPENFQIKFHNFEIFGLCAKCYQE